jgi:hypothetical protein
MRRFLFVIATAAVGMGLVAAAPALAAKPHALSAASCSVSGDIVDATGLPTGQVVNFLATDNTGTTGWVLGTTSTGNWSVNVSDLLAARAISALSGPASYQFVSQTWGPKGSKYTVFAGC